MDSFIKKIKSSGFSIAITVLVLLAFVLLNIFVGMLTERFFLRLDLTEAGVFTLSERAEEFLRNMDETVDIIVLAEESTWIANNNLAMVSSVLSNYAATSGGRIRVQYVNPDLNTFDGPNYGNLLSALRDSYTELENMDHNDIIFLSGRRAALVPVWTVFQQRQAQGGQPELVLRADEEFVGALTYVLNEGVARITFVTNHNENPTTMMQSIFERGGYVASHINLALEDIPEDTVLLVSAAPRFDFLEEEIIRLERFLGLGGNVMIIYDFRTQSLPRLDAFLLEWGIRVEQSVIFDEEFTFIPQFGVIGAVVAEGALPSTADAAIVTHQVQPMGVFDARPLRSEWIEGSRSGFSQFPLVRTVSASSYAKYVGGGDITTFEREPGDESGPFTLAYNVRYFTRDADHNQVFANLIVVSAGMFEDGFLSVFAGNFFNDTLLAALANDLNPFDTRVFIPPTALASTVMLVSAANARTILILMVIVVPLLIITAGIIVWRKRKHK